MEIPPADPGQKIAYGSDPNQFGELRLPNGQGPHPVVIFVHGGFWRATYDLTHTNHLCLAIAKAGCAVWSLEYRRVGQPGGGYPGTLDDVRAAVRHMTRIPHLDLNRVVVAGHSAGGHLALWLAASDIVSLRNVIALAPVSDLRLAHALKLGDGAVEAFLGCSPNECVARYAAASPIELLPMQTPQTLVHGTADDVVPFELSQRFANASANAHLVSLPDVGHLELIDPRAAIWPIVLDSILQGLAGTRVATA